MKRILSEKIFQGMGNISEYIGNDIISCSKSSGAELEYNSSGTKISYVDTTGSIHETLNELKGASATIKIEFEKNIQFL